MGNGNGEHEQPHKATEGSTEQVVSHVRTLIEGGSLRPGDRLPAEHVILGALYHDSR
jgi:DNA-binding FadR family transcriptional regulator